MFRIKAEQPTIHDEFERRPGRLSLSTAARVGSHIHGGKVVTRYLWFDSGLAGRHGYPGLRCAIRLGSVSADKTTGETSTEDRYYGTSPAESMLTGSQWGDLIRRHCSVETTASERSGERGREPKASPKDRTAQRPATATTHGTGSSARTSARGCAFLGRCST